MCDDPAGILPLTDKVFRVESPRSGFVRQIETEDIGHAVAEAGGGRVRTEDKIDATVGFLADVKIGDEIRSGDPIGLVYCADADRGRHAAERIQAAYEIGDEPPEMPLLIKEVIDK